MKPQLRRNAIASFLIIALIAAGTGSLYLAWADPNGMERAVAMAFVAGATLTVFYLLIATVGRRSRQNPLVVPSSDSGAALSRFNASQQDMTPEGGNRTEDATDLHVRLLNRN